MPLSGRLGFSSKFCNTTPKWVISPNVLMKKLSEMRHVDRESRQWITWPGLARDWLSPLCRASPPAQAPSGACWHFGQISLMRLQASATAGHCRLFKNNSLAARSLWVTCIHGRDWESDPLGKLRHQLGPNSSLCGARSDPWKAGREKSDQGHKGTHCGGSGLHRIRLTRSPDEQCPKSHKHPRRSSDLCITWFRVFGESARWVLCHFQHTWEVRSA